MSRLAVVAVASTALACITAQTPYMDGLLYEREHNLPQAIAAYTDALVVKPDFAPAHRRLAVLLKDTDPVAAASHAARVLAANPADAEMAALRGELAEGTAHAAPTYHRFSSALSHVDALLAKGEDLEALRFLDATVQDDPQACWAFERMHAVHLRRGDDAKAARANHALSACRSDK